jgi:hypothetical protein
MEMTALLASFTFSQTARENSYWACMSASVTSVIQGFRRTVKGADTDLSSAVRRSV